MININDIIKSIKADRLRITDHADEEEQEDKISFEEIFTSVLRGEIIEQYPSDKPYPSCLVLGRNFKTEPIHSVWAYNKKKQRQVS